MMPYAVNVSALGAIVSAAIALCGFQTWAALKVAPFIGAVAGFIFAICSLRRYGLSLDASLEDYRGAAGIVAEAPKQYLNAAFSIAFPAVLVELPAIMLGQNVALTLCAAGCLAVFVGTIYRCWCLTNSPLRLDVFQVAGGIGCLVIVGCMGYGLVRGMTIFNPIIPAADLVKLIFVANGIAAILSAVIACFMLALASSIVSRLYGS